MDMSLVMLALGAFRFGVSGADYQKLSRDANYRWSSVERLGRKPARQYAGPGEETINLEGVIYPHFKGGLHQVELMRLQAGLGVPMMMTDGLGWIWDRWTIDSVSETKSYFMADGAPRKIEFSVSLTSYGPDGGGSL